MIDKLDFRILKALLSDGRKKFTEIADEANVSKDVVYQRYKRMEEEGIIVGSTVMIDYRALGYNINLSVLLSVPIDKKQLIIEQLKGIQGFYDFCQWGSKSDLWAVMHLADSKQIEEVKHLIMKLPCLRVEFDIWTGVSHRSTNLSIFSEDDSSVDADVRILGGSKTNRASIEVDKLDRQIIEQLVYNCREPFGNIAKKTGNSTSTIMRRYQRLIHDRIVHPTIQIDPSKIGYPTDAVFRLKAAAGTDLNKIAEAIFEIPDIFQVLKTLGNYDYMVFSCTKSLEHLMRLVEQIGSVVGIQAIERATVVLPALTSLPFPAVPISTF
jgi:DNA-binding Lrp family transcriptional regulator